MKIKSSSIGLAGLMKKPSETGTTTSNLFKRTIIDQSHLSIFKKPRLNTGLQMNPLVSNTRFIGLRNSERDMQSDLKAFDSSSNTAPSSSTTKKIKRLAPLAKD